jgi:hypothetical protein
MSLFNPSRDQVRQFFFDTWHKQQQPARLTPLEQMALSVILMHPEYHAVLSAPERNAQREYFPEQGESNPFLHMSLHLSILEQISIDQPAGIRQIYQQLLQKEADEMSVQHRMMECLAEAIWQAQRHQRPLDGLHYQQQLQALLGD